MIRSILLLICATTVLADKCINIDYVYLEQSVKSPYIYYPHVKYIAVDGNLTMELYQTPCTPLNASTTNIWLETVDNNITDIDIVNIYNQTTVSIDVKSNELFHFKIFPYDCKDEAIRYLKAKVCDKVDIKRISPIGETVKSTTDKLIPIDYPYNFSNEEWKRYENGTDITLIDLTITVPTETISKPLVPDNIANESYVGMIIAIAFPIIGIIVIGMSICILKCQQKASIDDENVESIVTPSFDEQHVAIQNDDIPYATAVADFDGCPTAPPISRNQYSSNVNQMIYLD